MFPLRSAPAAPHLPPSRAACRPSGRPSAGPAWLGLLLATLGVTLGFAAPSRPSASTEVRRPNVLWVVSEDNTATFTGPYGDPLARTPTIDRLATQGIVFTHAYTAPVCAPSRSGIITGRYAHGLGSQHMRSTRPLPADATFFPTYLRNAVTIAPTTARLTTTRRPPGTQPGTETALRLTGAVARPASPSLRFSTLNNRTSRRCTAAAPSSRIRRG